MYFTWHNFRYLHTSNSFANLYHHQLFIRFCYERKNANIYAWWKWLQFNVFRLKCVNDRDIDMFKFEWYSSTSREYPLPDGFSFARADISTNNIQGSCIFSSKKTFFKSSVWNLKVFKSKKWLIFVNFTHWFYFNVQLSPNTHILCSHFLQSISSVVNTCYLTLLPKEKKEEERSLFPN